MTLCGLPADQGWLAWLALIPALIATEKAGFGRGLLLGEIFGLLFIFVSAGWLGIFGWEPRLLASVFYSLFFGFTFALWGWFSVRFPAGSDWRGVLLPPAIWTAMEWLKGQGIFAFSWGFLGLTQYKFQALIQAASVAGVFGISFILVLFNNFVSQTILAIWPQRERILNLPWKEFGRKESRKESWNEIVALLNEMFRSGAHHAVLRNGWAGFALAFLGIIILGVISIPYQTQLGAYEEVSSNRFKIGVIQPNVSLEEKGRPESRFIILQRLLIKTRKLTAEGSEMAVWPETAILQRNALDDPIVGKAIRSGAIINKIFLLTGLIDSEQDCYYNAAFLLSPEGKILDKYHKIHLVPMGEYLPLPKECRKCSLFDRVADYTHGKTMTVFETPKGKFSMLICFESMFDYLARRAVNSGAQFLVVITNDAWFERSSVAKGHFIMGIFRAVENRAWLVQCGNTGVSGIVDPWGRPVKETPIFTEQEFAVDIFPEKSGTIYTKLGNWLPVLCFPFFIIIGLVEILNIRKEAKGAAPGEKQNE